MPLSRNLEVSSPLLEYEDALWQLGYESVAGVDEVGRGPLAGPVVACACILPKHIAISGITDSKSLSAKQRTELEMLLTSHPEVYFALGIITSEEIDRVNILQATLLAMREAVLALSKKPDYLLVDGRDVPNTEILARAVIRGDSLSQSIAAASIIAKVHRDAMMQEYHRQYPQYGFDKHKGYGTKLHLEAIAKYGITPIHRRSFAPCKGLPTTL
jgi:ribonuclease HII